MKTKILLLLAAALLTVPGVRAQGSAFTYQGRLNQGGTPASGLFDFRFNVFAANSGGLPLTPSLDVAGVTTSNGLFTVVLDFGVGVFTGANRWLEIGVRSIPSEQTFTIVSPRQAITAAPYAIQSLSASAAGTVTGPVSASQITGTLASSNIAPGSITGSQLVSGAAAANLQASGQSGVASGGMVLSLSPTNSALANAGYVKLGTLEGTDIWQERAKETPPIGRQSHTAVWTGSEMIIWGGYAGGVLSDGARYSPAVNIWTPLSTNGAPVARQLHTAIWTGTEMIIWGGFNGVFLNDGGRYNVLSNSWAAVPTNNAPDGRYEHSAVWTGTEMIIWGGSNGGFFNDGGRYNPANNTWARPETRGAPAIRTLHTAVWTGTEMIIWGGLGADSALNDGGRYNPSANSWAAISRSGAPLGRMRHTAVWTGSEMMVWGGENGAYFNSGGRYDPRRNTWTALDPVGTVAGRIRHTALWTGSEMLIWGGFNGSYLNAGGAYNPVNNAWTATTTTSAPTARSMHTAVWTGTEMMVWGGFDSTYSNNGGRYNRSANTWTPMSSGPPSPRANHTAVWTGSEMIVWGGFASSATWVVDPDSGFIYQSFQSTNVNDGGRYNPALNVWTALNTNGAPSGRSGHTAVWTGSEMIVWGGLDAHFSNYSLNTGGRYNPVLNTWTSVNTNTGPVGRSRHTAVWTGEEMIIWGGSIGGGYHADSANSGRYNPALDTWTAINTSGGPTARESHTAVWTGNEMIIWGGAGNSGYLNDGRRYNPAADTWTVMPLPNIGPRLVHSAVWTGTEMIVWGGIGQNGLPFDGARYNPAANTWADLPWSTGAPTGRQLHTATWTGSDMIIWGGYNGSSAGPLTDARYNPSADKWTALGNSAIPRYGHTAVWTGNEVIFWGGQIQGTVVYLNEILSFTPGKTMFLYQKP